MQKTTHLHFSIEYYIYNGGCLCQYFVFKKFDKAVQTMQLNMHSKDNRIWTSDLKIHCALADELEYFFVVLKNGEIIDKETPRHFHRQLIGDDSEWDFHNYWHTFDDTSYIYSSAFNCCIFPFAGKNEKELKGNNVFLKLDRFVLPENKKLVVTGNQSVLGTWNPIKGKEVLQESNYCFSVGFNSLNLCFPVEYKFVLLDRQTNQVIWEEGENRRLEEAFSIGQKTVLEQRLPKITQGSTRVGGIMVPVFSLRSKKSWGVGDFGDLRLMIDWVSCAGLHVLQVLPLNDTTRTGSWNDSYPYNGVSAFALHPMYMDFNSLSALRDSKLMALLEKKRQGLNALPQVDYEAANKLKKEYFQAYFKENAKVFFNSREYKKFIKENKSWLLPYAYFRLLQKKFGTSDFHQWIAFDIFDLKKLNSWAFENGYSEKIFFYCVVQFLLDKQLKAVHEYARSKGVVLKGDLPIGISRDSATAWLNRGFFNFDGQAGAPPDSFSTEGQNWGFPTYYWKKILADGGTWWKLRISKMADYFDAFRIDHVLGFFRIWEIPSDSIYGTLGHFSPALPYSKKEILSYGFEASPEIFAEPSFSDEELELVFGNCTSQVRKFYLHKDNTGFWYFKKAFASQRKIGEAISNDEKKQLRKVLMKGLCNTLFIEDKKKPKYYHINIGGKASVAYLKLSETDKEAYKKLYDDFFYHRHNNLWAQEGLRRLSVMNSTPMLVCAEDLGMVPACVHEVLDKFKILSLEVESMPKRSEGSFSVLEHNPFLSVDTITTHDMEPMRLWWKNHPIEAKKYFQQRMDGQGVVPEKLSAELGEKIVANHLRSPSLLCIIALQDWLAMDEKLRNPNMELEQINCPADPHHYWRYRMHLNIEQLLGANSFNEKIKNLLKASGRRY